MPLTISGYTLFKLIVYHVNDYYNIKVDDLELSSLLLRSCEVGHPGVNALCATQPSITELDLSFCARITDTALSSICTNLIDLQKLSVQSCRAITDLGISYLSQLQHLSDLDLQGLERITSEGRYVKRLI